MINIMKMFITGILMELKTTHYKEIVKVKPQLRKIMVAGRVPGALQDALENAMLITRSRETSLSPQICIRGSHSELCFVPLVGESGQFLPILRIPARHFQEEFARWYHICRPDGVHMGMKAHQVRIPQSSLHPILKSY